MKAIQITTAIKNANQNLFQGYALNSIKIFNSLPTSFAGVSKNFQRTDMYQTLSNAIHEADGFYDVVVPTINDATQKLGTIFFNVDHFTYPIVAKTQQEQDDYTQQQEDADAASTFFNQRKADGEIYLDRFNAYVYRQVVNSQITKPQAISALNFFYDALHPLKMGYFELAQTKVTALSGNAQITALKNKILTNLSDYLNNE